MGTIVVSQSPSDAGVFRSAAASILGVPVKAVDRLVARGLIRTYAVPGCRIRHNLEDILSVKAKATQGAALTS